jgi:phytoene dehydrogenase-like protein
MDEGRVVVVGGGLAGLAAAGDLVRAGHPVMLLEGSDGVGGRVRTDRVQGFLLDRGFQVLLVAYPEAERRLDLGSLELRPFKSGALVRKGGGFHRLVDPGQDPMGALRSATAPVGTLTDKLKVAKLRQGLLAVSPESLLDAPAGEPGTGTTLAWLQEEGISPAMVDAFFRPFLGGVLLDPGLQVSARLARFYMQMFARGGAALPARGMGAIPAQLLRRLPGDAVRTGVRVRSVAPGEVTLEDGETIRARAVVVATEGPEAARLLHGKVEDPGSRAVHTLDFAAPTSPVGEGILVLNGEGPGAGPVNHLAVLSDVAPEYAAQADGRALVSVSVLEDPAHPAGTAAAAGVSGGADRGGQENRGQDAGGRGDLEAAVREQLQGWYGPQVGAWELIRHHRISHGQPLQTPEQMEPPHRPVRLAEGLFVCGDHRDHASIHGALASGGRAAAAVREALG